VLSFWENVSPKVSEPAGLKLKKKRNSQISAAVRALIRQVRHRSYGKNKSKRLAAKNLANLFCAKHFYFARRANLAARTTRPRLVQKYSTAELMHQ
jgi:hypothetical protein